MISKCGEHSQYVLYDISYKNIHFPSSDIHRSFFSMSNLFKQALAALDASDWPAAASFSNTAHVKSCELHSTFFSHVHDLTVTAATTNIDSHNNTYIKEAVLKNFVEEIDLNDEDSFMYFYTKFVIICAVLFITAFNSVKSVVKKYRRRSLLGI